MMFGGAASIEVLLRYWCVVSNANVWREAGDNKIRVHVIYAKRMYRALSRDNTRYERAGASLTTANR